MEISKPTPRTRGQRGLLKDFVEMPMDILYEILCELDPIDLLNLARTTKALRAVLMSRLSMFIWKSARSHIAGLPECPDDLNEPQYAALMFDTRCSVSYICETLFSL
ncbi:hypothetical protein BDN70DRAFT_817465 [Pholiota conissans]|uniref:F-box domain-containing protein n=1 Tax=Pholiota conissans TaxID=109636 RepID=A0A9P6CTS5_9AGAR|nr:hypothetical protein BDN70DRAFT_817465 [Pholiota conissans]